MKCPKCSYIGFEESDRCRNCGYEFALSDAPPAPADLPMRAGDDDGGPLVDLALRARGGRDAERPRTPVPARSRLDLDRLIGVEPQTPDLPLFGSGAPAEPDLPPLVSAPASPRRPLSVRRQTPPPARVRRAQSDARNAAGTLDLPLPGYAPPEHAARADVPHGHAIVLAGPAPRISAALLDVVLLGGVHCATIYLTLRLCGLASHDWRVLPVVPLLAFFLLVDGGYLVAFTTAGGQTIGKMACGIKVVRDGDESMSIGVATVRALGTIASTLCLGAGLIPALVHEDRRAIHDRLAGTSVVRLPA
jgi:uncharacterized RDD family membrane protein YckC